MGRSSSVNIRMELYNLFPIPLGRFNLDRDLASYELDFIQNKINYKKNLVNFSSEDTYILKQPPLYNLSLWIQECINEFFKEINRPDKKTHLTITQSWVNITGQGQAHQKHKHWNSFYSGVFYINAIENQDKIYFHNYSGLRDIQVTPTEHNIYNSMTWWIPVKSKELIIFPSNLYHEVDIVEHDKNRVSLSFNTFPTGHLGNAETSTELIIPGLGH